ncbi:FAD-dependent monooxygenase [Streptomyces sp. NPDC000880]
MNDTETAADAHRPPHRPRTAVVLGGGLAGILAASALSNYAHVTVVERDTLPRAATPRKGSPQARHAHLLWSGGAEAIEALVPGTLQRLLDRGAHRVPLPTGMVAYSPRGWFRRWDESHYMMLASRDLLDWTVRERVLASEQVTVVERAEVLGLEGTAGTVTGVRIRRGDGTETVLTADLVIDTTGRASRAPEWLAHLGYAPPKEEEVNSRLVYASRVYRAPEKARAGFPVVNVQADSRSSGPGQAGTVLPIEDGRWLVTLSGTRGGEPTKDPEAFEPFARRLRHPIVADLIANAEPLTEVSVTRNTGNCRRFYEKLTAWPEGFVVIGDAVAAYNPIYGHGMSVAAQSVAAILETVSRQGWATPGLARRIQKAVARPVSAAWNLAIGQDIHYPGATENGPDLLAKGMAAFVDRLILTSTGNGRVARRVTDVMTLQRGSHVLVTPSILLAAVLGPLRPQLQGPPLTTEEFIAAGH